MLHWMIDSAEYERDSNSIVRSYPRFRHGSLWPFWAELLHGII